MGKEVRFSKMPTPWMMEGEEEYVWEGMKRKRV